MFPEDVFLMQNLIRIHFFCYLTQIEDIQGVNQMLIRHQGEGIKG
jgi:hypothetical protein